MTTTRGEFEGWMAGSDAVPMFPTMVWKIRLGDAVAQTVEASVLPLLEALRSGEGPLSPGEGWQSERALHRREELATLVRCIHRAGRGVLRFLRIGYEDLEITGCWANVLPTGAGHRMHSHPNNFFSGVYYLRTAPGADTINFHDPRAQTGIIRPPVAALTAENTDQVVMRVENGTLLLFPAWLTHSVDTNEAGVERVSISFNLMFRAYTENLAQPMW